MTQKNKPNKGLSLIPQFVANKKEVTKYLNKDVALMEGWRSSGNNAFVFLSLRFVQSDYQCFSEWTKTEMDAFWDYNRKIHEITWAELLKQGGKGENKAGFAPTIIPRDKYPKQFIDKLDPFTDIIEMRVNSKIRVHGFRYQPIYYICYLDRSHAICD